MAMLFKTAQAQEDLITIWLYIAKDSFIAADKLLEKFENVFEVLIEQPEFGAARPDIAPELRYFPVGSYLIFYRIIAEGIQIVRVVHGSRLLIELEI